MKFYNRTSEIKELQRIQKLSFDSYSRMTVITGRQRIGKTSLVVEATKGEGSTVYLFVSRKNETTLCEEFTLLISFGLGTYVPPEIKSFRSLFQMVMELAKTRKFNLIIDEFQEFEYVNLSVYSDVQNLWDQYRKQTYLKLILMGSVFSMMHKVFEGYKEPLFEKYFRLKMMESQQYSAIGSWRERKKGKDTDEIDIIGLFAGDKKALIVEVKRLRRNYDHKEFMEKIECVKTRILSKYKIEIRLLTLEDNQFSDMSKRLDRKICV
nr:ATP-binding protein [Odoribacter splanchnicus]